MSVVVVSPGRVGRWTPAQVSSHTPAWDQWRHGWWSNQLDTYNPAHYLTPADRYRLAHPRNFVIPRATYNVPPNPYFDRAWVAMYTAEEKGRMGQDINWFTLGTKGG